MLNLFHLYFIHQLRNRCLIHNGDYLVMFRCSFAGSELCWDQQYHIDMYIHYVIYILKATSDRQLIVRLFINLACCCCCLLLFVVACCCFWLFVVFCCCLLFLVFIFVYFCCLLLFFVVPVFVVASCCLLLFVVVSWCFLSFLVVCFCLF